MMPLLEKPGSREAARAPADQYPKLIRKPAAGAGDQAWHVASV
jgi:hypothetical protein